MKAKKIAALLALMICFIAVLGACTPLNFDESEEAAADGETAGETAAPKLVMATEAAFAPYEYLNGQDVAGIDIDIAEK
jgi:polar amino acid transport system substrate-binding protein